MVNLCKKLQHKHERLSDAAFEAIKIALDKEILNREEQTLVSTKKAVIRWV